MNWDDPKQREEDLQVLNAKNARIVYYQELVRSAFDTYRQYTEQKQEAGRVYQLLQSIDAEIPDDIFVGHELETDKVSVPDI